MLAAELFEAVHASVDHVKTSRVAETNGVLSTEGHAWNGSHFTLAQKLLTEVHGLDADWLNANQEVESALWLDHLHVLDRLETAEHVLTADVELIAHVSNDLLVTLESGNRAILGEAGRVAGGVALDCVNRVSDFLWSGCVAQAPASHSVGLGETIDRDGVIKDVFTDAGNADVLIAAIHQFFVNLVGEDKDVFCASDLTQSLQLFF